MFPKSAAMNTFFAPILVICALQFVAILPVAGKQYNRSHIKRTACPGAAHIYGYHGFTYVFDPPIQNTYPYIYRLWEKLTIGQAVTIRGSIPRFGEGYAAIVLSSETPVEDGPAPLWMRIMIGDKHCYFNSVENLELNFGFKKPLNLSYYEEFEVVIRVLTDKFEIILNGYHYADFPYEMPIDIVDTVSVHYDFTRTEFRIGGRDFKNIRKVDFPGGHLKLNERVIIEGVSTANDFAINLLDANGRRILHIRPYFSAGVVFRDTEPFGNDERSNGNPFTQGKHFMLELYNRADHIEIYVNRAPFTTYKHRISNPETSYKAVEFDNNVVIENLEICTDERS